MLKSNLYVVKICSDLHASVSDLFQGLLPVSQVITLTHVDDDDNIHDRPLHYVATGVASSLHGSVPRHIGVRADTVRIAPAF